MALQPEVHGFVMLSNPDTDTDPENAPLFLPMAEQNKRPAGTAEPFRVARSEAMVSGFDYQTGMVPVDWTARPNPCQRTGSDPWKLMKGVSNGSTCWQTCP
jgi:hypothetical protein